MYDRLSLTVDGVPLFLQHYPMLVWPGKEEGVIHLYGHLHGGTRPLPGSMDVGVDTWGGAPATLGEIQSAISRNSGLVAPDAASMVPGRLRDRTGADMEEWPEIFGHPYSVIDFDFRQQYVAFA